MLCMPHSKKKFKLYSRSNPKNKGLLMSADEEEEALNDIETTEFNELLWL